ncbi:MAG: hypothetical protein MZV64_73075 [Ignavibacteriales bacterium]|nr:hypothetical protein [Ignavibacteriales bacterium]
MPTTLGPLEELVSGDHGLEPVAGHEVVVDAVAPRRAGPAGCVYERDRPDAGHPLDQALDDRGLAGAGRRRHHEQPAAPGATRHSAPARASSRVRP